MLGPDYVSGFSSKGPTIDGRIKPDIVAPGEWILSACNNQTEDECGTEPEDYPQVVQDEDEYGVSCDTGLMYLFGTSMSTPIVSGTLAIMRQYFREGFYPTGERNDADSFDPPGVLLKAALLNGGQKLKAVDNYDYDVLPYPSEPYDFIQGFGRVSLENTLYLKGWSNMKFYYDSRHIYEDNEYQFTTTIAFDSTCKSNVLSITLVWMDTPGASGCKRCLLNDLDLQVFNAEDGFEWNSTEIYYPNGKPYKDDINTVERVRIPDVSEGETYTIHVIATNFEDTGISVQYALVVTGCVTSLDEF